MNRVSQHFDNVAEVYDRYKRKNWYYYSQVKKLYSCLIPPHQTVLEIGCGTGDILTHVEPQYGTGIDISDEMIKIARSKYESINDIEFMIGSIEKLKGLLVQKTFDYIFLADVLEHLENPKSTFQTLSGITDSNTKIIISAANPLWEPILIILERIKLKMPEGPHHRIGTKQFEAILAQNGFAIIQKGYRVILPAYIPFISNIINKYFYNIPILKKLCLVMFWVYQKTDS